ELAKLLQDPAFVGFLMEMLQELRHHRVSFMGCLQHLNQVPAGMLGLTSNIFLFGTQDPGVLRRLKEDTGLSGWKQEEVNRLETGVALCYAPQSNDKDYARGELVYLRPTCMRAGGETLTAQ